MGCIGVDPLPAASTTEASDAGPPGSSGSSGAGTSTGLEPASGDEGTTGAPLPGTTSGSTGAATTTGPGSTGSASTTTESAESTGPEPQACADGCAVEFACGDEWASEEECVSWCEANLVEAYAFSPFCRAAWEGVSACVATLTCEEFMVWQAPTEFPYPCSDADVILTVECEGQ